jgi:hypothetical protein
MGAFIAFVFIKVNVQEGKETLLMFEIFPLETYAA